MTPADRERAERIESDIRVILASRDELAKDVPIWSDLAMSTVLAALDEARADAEKWRAAEAEGHVVDFTETGFGLQHPPSCRPDLIGCRFNVYLSDASEPEEEPGRYRMTWDGHFPTFVPAPSDPVKA